MKSITRLTKLLQAQKRLFMILLAALSQAAFAQETGYWDDRFGPPNYLYDYVSAIAVIDSGIYIGGSFTDHKSVAMWNGKGWSALGTGIIPPPGKFDYGAVAAFAVLGNDLYAGGQFAWAGNLPANNIAKWNLVTKSWSAVESNGNNGVNGTVRALVARGDKLYVGGQFTLAGGTPAKGIAVWDDSSKTWTPLGQGVEGTVKAIAVSGRDLYVGGIFASAGGKPANNIAKWNGKEWFALGSGVSPEGKPFFSTPYVNAIVILGDEVYVGGGFIKVGDVNARSIAKWNILHKSWSALSSGNTKDEYYGVNGNVYALAANGRAIYVGGTFTQAGEQSANEIAKWDPNNNSWSPLGSGVEGGQVFAITTRCNDVCVGGGFRYAGGKRSDRFAIWHEPTPRSNHAPVWSKLPNVTFPEDSHATLDLNHFVSDRDHALNELTYSTEVIDFQSSAADANNDLQISIKRYGETPHYVTAIFTSTGESNGIHTVVFTVTDACGESASDTIKVTVTPVNDAPVIATLPTLTFNEDDSLLYPIRNWFAYVTDVDDADSTLTFRLLSGKSIKAARRGSSHLFTAPANWNGTNTLKLIVKDRGQLADTAALVIKVNPINDAPKISGLPDSLSFRNDGSIELKIWDFVEDVETPDAQLSYHFAASNDSLQRNFNTTTGILRLTAPHFSGPVHLFITASDGKAMVRDTVAVRVELTTGVVSTEEQIPTEFVLFQNYPNPFNPTTVIRFGLPYEAEVKIEVVNLSGQHVVTLRHERKPAGYHNVEFDARNLTSGVYFYRLTAGKFTAMKKLMLVQ